MKKITTLLFASVALLASCSDDNSKPVGPILDFTTASINFPETAVVNSTQTFTFTSTRPWTAEISTGVSWITVSPVSGNAGSTVLTVTVLEENMTDAARSASITVKAGTATGVINVTQAPRPVFPSFGRALHDTWIYSTDADNWTTIEFESNGRYFLSKSANAGGTGAVTSSIGQYTVSPDNRSITLTQLGQTTPFDVITVNSFDNDILNLTYKLGAATAVTSDFLPMLVAVKIVPASRIMELSAFIDTTDINNPIDFKYNFVYNGSQLAGINSEEDGVARNITFTYTDTTVILNSTAAGSSETIYYLNRNGLATSSMNNGTSGNSNSYKYVYNSDGQLAVCYSYSPTAGIIQTINATYTDGNITEEILSPDQDISTHTYTYTSLGNIGEVILPGIYNIFGALGNDTDLFAFYAGIMGNASKNIVDQDLFNQLTYTTHLNNFDLPEIITVSNQDSTLIYNWNFSY